MTIDLATADITILPSTSRLAPEIRKALAYAEVKGKDATGILKNIGLAIATAGGLVVVGVLLRIVLTQSDLEIAESKL